MRLPPVIGRGLDGCEPEDLCLDSHMLEGLGVGLHTAECRRTRLDGLPAWQRDGGPEGGLTRPWAGGLDSHPRIEGGRRRGWSMAPTAPSATSRAGARAKDWAGPEARSASRRATCSPEQGPGLRRPAGMARGLSRRSTCAGWRARASRLRQVNSARLGMLSRAEARDAGGMQRESRLLPALKREACTTRAPGVLASSDPGLSPPRGWVRRSARLGGLGHCCARGDGMLDLQMRSGTG